MNVSHRQDVAEAPRAGRVLATAVLALVLAAQLMFVFVGLVGMALGGVSVWQFWLFVVVAVGVLWGLLWVTVAIIRRRQRPRAAVLALVAPVVDLALYAVVTGGLFAGSCTARETQIIDEVPPFGGADIEFGYEAQSGSCAGSLDVTATADEVTDHYERELDADGWNVVIEDVPAHGDDDTLVVKDLTASRGDERFTIALESYSGRVNAAIRIDA